MAESGLYQLLKNEEILMATALKYDCATVENEFNKMITSAVDDYHMFNATVLTNPTPTNTEILTNFDEFFEFVLDVKKHEKENAALSSADDVIASVEQHAASTPNTPPPSGVRKGLRK